MFLPSHVVSARSQVPQAPHEAAEFYHLPSKISVVARYLVWRGVLARTLDGTQKILRPDSDLAQSTTLFARGLLTAVCHTQPLHLALHDEKLGGDNV